ncbi:MAG: hypothetical protein ACRD1Y_10605 [Terriglobales bacterium]
MAGLSEEEAKAAANRSPGNITRIEERYYESTHWMPWDDRCHDVRQVLRSLRASPSYAVAAVVILAVAMIPAQHALHIDPLDLLRKE